MRTRAGLLTLSTPSFLPQAKCEEEAQTIQDEVSKRLDDLLTLTERVERLVGSNRPSEAGRSRCSPSLCQRPSR